MLENEVNEYLAVIKSHLDHDPDPKQIRAHVAWLLEFVAGQRTWIAALEAQEDQRRKRITDLEAMLVRKQELVIAYQEEYVVREIPLALRCPTCEGTGTQFYDNTSTWQRGAGGSMVTEDVCDRCWGTGRTDRHGGNLREVHSRIRSLVDELALLRGRVGAGDPS